MFNRDVRLNTQATWIAAVSPPKSGAKQGLNGYDAVKVAIKAGGAETKIKSIEA